MDEQVERYHRIVRAPIDDEFVIEPPQVILDEANRLAQDPRRPVTAISRWVSQTWVEQQRERITIGVDSPEPLSATDSQKELIWRPAHYPTHWGIGFIPHPTDVSGWRMGKLTTTCYTNLSVPRPFDPSLHGDLTSQTVGLGWNYQGKSPFPDRYDIVNRRGGGPRGGFSYTTGPTEGAYPNTINPSPTFNLSELGFTDGGWNPEGLQWTNRPKRVRLNGLRNGWAHKAYFVRSRQVMFRNVYGDISNDEATPHAPSVVINGTLDVQGVQSVSMRRAFNSPTTVSVHINNSGGRRSGLIKEGDTIQIFISPRTWAQPPLVFTGFVSDVSESVKSLIITGIDALGYLANEPLLTEPTYSEVDAANVIKDIIGGSSYKPPIGRLTNDSRIILPPSLNLKNQTRLGAIQTILSIVNNTPNRLNLFVDEHGLINLVRLSDIDDTTKVAFVGGRIPKTDVPQDLYPTSVVKESGDLEFFNKVTVKNSAGTIQVTEPTTNPSRPVHRLVIDDAVSDEQQARLVARQLIQQQGDADAKWSVTAIPERLDIRAGDIVEFANVGAGLAGRKMVFNVRWMIETSGAEMLLTVGRESADLVGAIRYASELSY